MRMKDVGELEGEDEDGDEDGQTEETTDGLLAATAKKSKTTETATAT